MKCLTCEGTGYVYFGFGETDVTECKYCTDGYTEEGETE